MRRILKMLTNTPLKGVFGWLGSYRSYSEQFRHYCDDDRTGKHRNHDPQPGCWSSDGSEYRTTVTAQLIAFNIANMLCLYHYGVTMLLLRKSRTMERWSQIIIGFVCCLLV
jgi:hypothetical protein